MIYNLQKFNAGQKTLIVIFHDAAAITICFLMAHSLRFGVFYPEIFEETYFLLSLPIVIALQLACLKFSNVYKAIWRFASIPDLIRVIKGVTLSIPVTLFALFLFNRLEGFPRSAFIIDWFLLILALGGGRFSYRILSDRSRSKFNGDQAIKNILIIGAGVGGEKLLRDIRYTPTLGIRVIGFIDDNKSIVKRTLNGVTILGTTNDLPSIITDHDISQVFIAIPSATSQEIRNILAKIEGLNIEVKTLPKINDVIYGKIEYSQLRKIEAEDLLGRTPVNLNMDEIANFIRGKRVLVTGAGGSIGAEICRQVLKFDPELLIGFEQSEIAVYDLKKQIQGAQAVFVIGDVRQEASINSAIARYKPQVVFHAAAYKHVPLMEENPIEAIKTNVLGTLNTAKASIQNTVDKFVLVSTDKAINPTNVMGTTKRLAEMVCQSLDSEANTEFVMIRFGNVLGSSGSVIPLFKEQIANGGPVTVTHPDVIRYFMSIPEACQLVLQAGSLGIRGQVMVLDMGQPVKILDLAKEMIKLAGFKYGEDIEIEFTGLRPGEKMFEEIFKDNEKRIQTSNDKIFISKTMRTTEDFKQRIEQLIALDYSTKKEQVLLTLQSLVPEFTPTENKTSASVH
mgnify:CR=1 FL=1|tara:strand:- start:72692 stop:74560 length:1869 start_codon:yes stop_codon:yes gene_type:complete